MPPTDVASLLIAVHGELQRLYPGRHVADHAATIVKHGLATFDGGNLAFDPRAVRYAPRLQSDNAATLASARNDRERYAAAAHIERVVSGELPRLPSETTTPAPAPATLRPLRTVADGARPIDVIENDRARQLDNIDRLAGLHDSRTRKGGDE